MYLSLTWNKKAETVGGDVDGEVVRKGSATGKNSNSIAMKQLIYSVLMASDTLKGFQGKSEGNSRKSGMLMISYAIIFHNFVIIAMEGIFSSYHRKWKFSFALKSCCTNCLYYDEDIVMHSRVSVSKTLPLYKQKVF